MSPRAALSLVAILILGQSASIGQEAKKDSEASLNDVSLEINAFQTLKQFEFSYDQLEQLQKWSKETAQKERPRDAGKTSKEFAEKLREFHKALVANSDDDRIDQLNEEVDELRESEKPNLDDGVDTTDAARKRAVEAFRSLKPAQLAAYLGKTAEETLDPLDRLKAALDDVRPLKGAEWRGKRDEIADEIGRLVAGVDQDKADKVNDEVAALLIRARKLSDAEFRKQRAELDQAAAKIIGNVSAHDVLRHQTELALADLLSNPRLHAVLGVRLK